MKISRKTATTIALLLISIFAISLVAIPTAKANADGTIWEFPSYAYIVASPNPIGVGQKTSIVMWIDYPLPSAAVGNDIRRHDYTLTITDPNGKVETEHWDVVYDSTSIQYYQFTPSVVGTYTLKLDYPKQTYTWSGTYQNDTFAAATKTTTLTVQEEQLPEPISSYPLPTEYWTRPIEGQNTGWSTIASNWLGSPQIENRFQPDGAGPNTPHVMWSKPLQFGGVVGGTDVGVEGNTYYMGGSYNVRFSNPLIMYGILYYQESYGNSGGGGDYVGVDLRTGQELWRKNVTEGGAPSFGYTYSLDNGNQHGVVPNGALVSSGGGGMYGGYGGAASWKFYDPRTGVLTNMNVYNVPSGTSVLGPQGEIIRYIVTNYGNATNPQWYLLQWNSSRVFGGESGTMVGSWYSGNVTANVPLTPARPTSPPTPLPPGYTTQNRNSWSWRWDGNVWAFLYTPNITIATGTVPSYDFNISITMPNSASWSINRANYANIMLLTQGSFGGRGGNYYGGNWYGANITALNLNASKGTVGQKLWNKYYPAPPGNVTRDLAAWDPVAGVFVFEDRETLVHHGYSLANGEKIWGPTTPAEQYDYFRSTTRSAYGKIYFAGYGGVVHCYDIKTGEKLWSYGNGGEGNSTSSGLTTAWGVYPIFMPAIADGKLYLATTEHSPGSPYYKDVKYRCINATDGTEIWTLMGWGTGMDANYDIVADGFFVFLNCYDMQVYCVGKGPSAMTLEAPMTSIPQGSSLVIRGSVTDISAGTEQDAIARRFPNGVAAVSDANMEGWMEYVYMQKPRPMDTVGVNVTLSVYDANNNFREIGTVTSDSDGFFSYQWTPDIPGKFTVIASFAGSESYWPSHAETAFAVDATPEATPNPTPTPPSMAETYFLPMSVGMIVAIVAVGALLALLLLRKRP